RALNGNFTINLEDDRIIFHHPCEDKWTVHLVDTGLKTQTGGRVKRLSSFLEKGTFMLTYGDGVSDVNILAVLKFHREQKKLGTITAVRPPARFGDLTLDGNRVVVFSEKPQTGEGWINGGFAVFEPAVLDFIANDQTSFERAVLEELARQGQLNAFRHEGFWQCMDTQRDMRILEWLWQSDNPPWKVWKSI
ncbi:MAG: sugar phosphate nucleotidyltransferase, partial [Candidatus Omnitrophica bacterium]|nr:sugar phosphate nucleotidyltransferase [Candidatus Omnitrophota bacterium]